MSKSIAKRLKAAERHIQKLERENAVLMRIRDRLIREHQVALGQKRTAEALLSVALAAGEIEVPIEQLVRERAGMVECRIDDDKKYIRVRRRAEIPEDEDE